MTNITGKTKAHSMGEGLPGRKWLLLGAAGSLLFVLFGSLVPFAYQPVSLQEAWKAFEALAFDGLLVRSRADLGANFLLMVPAGFFGMGLVWGKGSPVLMGALGIGVWCVCLAVSFASEFGQIFFIGRTPALSDIVMQAIGSLAGIVAWCLWGRIIWVRLFENKSKVGAINAAEKILWGYLIVLIGYSVIPLDIRISPVAVYHKFMAGRLVLIPFGFDYESFTAFAYATVTDFLIWVPVGFLRILTGRKSTAQAWLWMVGAVVIIEGSQIFIGSRIFDVTDILLGIVGGGTGIFLGRKIPYDARGTVEARGEGLALYRSTWIGLALACLWCLVLVAVFWYPYEIRIEKAFVEGQIERFFQAPLSAYYYSRPLQAFSAMLRKILFFLPLGVFVGLALRPLQRIGPKSLLFFIAAILSFGAGLGIELGQVIMPRKIPDSTDLFFETGGGVLGYWLIQVIAAKRGRKERSNVQNRGHEWIR
jgi:VanZ family protein